MGWKTGGLRCIATFFSLLPKLNPGVPFSTMKQEMPFGPTRERGRYSKRWLTKWVKRLVEKWTSSYFQASDLGGYGYLHVCAKPCSPVRAMIRYTSVSPAPLIKAYITFKENITMQTSARRLTFEPLRRYQSPSRCALASRLAASLPAPGSVRQ